MKISSEKDYLKVKDIAQLGPEPFDIKDVNYFIKKVKTKKIEQEIKQNDENNTIKQYNAFKELTSDINLKEIPNMKFGTQSEIYWDDAFLGTQVGAMTRGTYTLKISDPILFIKNFVPATYLQSCDVFDFADMDNDAGAQLFNEVVSKIQGLNNEKRR